MPESKKKTEDQIETGGAMVVETLEFVNRYFQVFYIVIIVVLLGVSVFFLYDYYSTQVDNVNQNLSRKQIELNNKKQDLEEIQQLKVDYEQLETEAQILFDALPDQSDLPSLYVQLQSMVEKNGLIIQSFNVAEAVESPTEENKDELQAVDINLNINGTDYQKFKQLLGDIEYSLRILDVTSINYDPRLETFSLILKTYYKIEG
jgi:Tfp pilus assembly protein PilO